MSVSTKKTSYAGFEDADAFKLYTLDIGLHGAMTDLDARTLITGYEF